MLTMQKAWMRRFTGCALAGACIACLLPAQADAQIFGGRVRNWLRGNSARTERIPPDEPVVIVEPRIVLPGDPEPAYDDRPRYSDSTDYGPGVSDRSRRESRLSSRRRAARPADDYELRSEERTVRSAEGRRSVLRAPEDRWQREEYAGERDIRDVDRDVEMRDADVAAEPRRGERTVRIDRFEENSSISPAEDPYEREENAAERSRVTSRGRTRELEDRSLSGRKIEDRNLELRDARGRAADEDLVEEPPPVDHRRPRSDDRVRPAAAEEVADEAEGVELPAAKDRDRPEAVDEFDMPRSAREPDAVATDKAKQNPAAASSSSSRAAERKTSEARPPKPPAKERERPEPSDEDAELLPPPPDDE